MPKKLVKKSARLSTNSWSRALLLGYVVLKSSAMGMILEMVVKTDVNISMSFSLYTADCPICRPPISVRHLSVMFRKSGISRKRERRTSMVSVSKMYPNGIQLKKRSSVSKVALMRLAELAVLKISEQS